MSERDFQNAVLHAAKVTGWKIAHFRPAQTSKGWRTPVAGDGRGFPDCVLVHPAHGLLLRELKTDAGRLTPEQAEWLRALEAAGVDCGVWKPSDWPRIEQELLGVAA